MKFDLIIGNPPYNVNLPKPKHYIYDKIGKPRFGTTGFILHCSYLLKDYGEIIFVNPFNFGSSKTSRDARRNIVANCSLKSIDLLDCPPEWITLGFSAQIVINRFQKDALPSYTCNGTAIPAPSGPGYEIICPNAPVAFNIWQKVINKTSLTIKDICEIDYLRAPEHRNKTAPEGEWVNEVHKSWDKGGKALKKLYVRYKPYTNKKPIVCVTVIRNGKYPSFQPFILSPGQSPYNAIVFATDDPLYVSEVIGSKLFRCLFLIQSPHNRPTTSIAKMPVWPTGVNPYVYFGFSQDEIDYIQREQYTFN